MAWGGRPRIGPAASGDCSSPRDDRPGRHFHSLGTLSRDMVTGMKRAERREIWAQAIVDALQEVFSNPVVRSDIERLRADTRDAMEAADNDNRDKDYERHRALSAIIQKLPRG